MGKNNAGIDNSGDRNSGYWNSGNWNSGDWNSGNRNPGNGNSGNRNSGNWNSGYWNSGNCNSGDGNSGDWNSGDGNSGDWNSGYWNSGYLNTNEPTVRMFNKDTGMTRDEVFLLFPSFFGFELNEWIQEEAMTKEEKEEYPEYKTTGGYLKTIDYQEAWRDSWNRADDEDRRKCLDLPNWNNELFLEISGIDVEKELGSQERETIKIGGVEYDKADVEERLKGIKPVN